jgi:hypothetical protein
MRKYVASVEREAHQIPIGEIVGDDSDTASFRYNATTCF